MSSPYSDVEYRLIGSHTRYSSWTARIEILLEYYSIPYSSTIFNVVVHRGVALPYSPAGLVPILIVTPKSPSLSSPPLTVTDTISIAEYLAETHQHLPLWPTDHYLRALARSAVAEMHAGFSEVRNTYSTNFIAQYTGPVPVSEKAHKEIQRLLKLWGDSRKTTAERLKVLGKEHEDEGFLFGKFGIADSFFWPVLWRFRTYNLPLETATPEALSWMKKMWEDPCSKRLGEDYWKQAEDPESLIPQYEDLFKDIPDVVYGRVNKDWQFSA